MNDQPPGSGPAPKRLSSRRFAWFETLLSGLNSVGTLWIFLLMVVISTDVIGRTAFNAPLPGVLELVQLSIVGIVFIQLGHTLRAGRITRSDSFIHFLQRRFPRAGYGLQAVYALLGTGIFVLLFNASLPMFINSWESGEYAGVEGYVTYPTWPVRLIILIGSVCAGLQYLVFAWCDLRAAWTGIAPVEETSEGESLAYGAEN